MEKNKLFWVRVYLSTFIGTSAIASSYSLIPGLIARELFDPSERHMFLFVLLPSFLLIWVFTIKKAFYFYLDRFSKK